MNTQRYDYKEKTTILHVQRQENTAYSSNKLYMLNHK